MSVGFLGRHRGISTGGRPWDEVGDECFDCGVLDADRGAHSRTTRIAVCGVWANASAGTAATVTEGLKSTPPSDPVEQPAAGDF